MNNTYYVLSMGWMASHKSHITVRMNLHIMQRFYARKALRYTQLLPATAVLLMTWNHLLFLKEFSNFLFSGP